jgi:deoxyribodipyrimidine photo-lyase
MRSIANDSGPSIVWFRQDLRLNDHPPLIAAAAVGAPILPIYVLDEQSAGEWALGAASRWWLHQSLQALNADLDGQLGLLRGNATRVLPALVERVGARRVFWARCTEPWRRAQDRVIESLLAARGCEAVIAPGDVLFEPESITKQDGTPYKVFTPYYRKGCLTFGPPPRVPTGRPEPLNLVDVELFRDILEHRLDALGLLPRPAWYGDMARTWTPGERGATRRLHSFLREGLGQYRYGRDRPDQEFVSRLSPHLHFGELSPQQVWYAAKALEKQAGMAANVDHFLSELGWREFSRYLLHHWPELPRTNWQSRFDTFPWRDSGSELRCWQRGLTGYPIVDAGMRELWQTGYMHNRVRMIVASFLVKNLLIHWHRGAEWFWDTLVDADLANNSASWQWIAGCGADAAPYFRIFNPVSQGLKFDPNGAYVRRYVPELARLPDEHVHAPWTAPVGVLAAAYVRLGRDYPAPIVDLKASRERALAAFRSLGETR